MNLAPLNQRFVLHFGEMGSRWSINRTVGQFSERWLKNGVSAKSIQLCQ